MKESTTKEKVLKKIRDALVNAMGAPFEGVDLEAPVIHRQGGAYREEAFVHAFNDAGGRFVFCRDADELAEGLQTLISRLGVGRLFCREGFLRDFLAGLQIVHEHDPQALVHCDAALTACEALVVRNGSIVLSSRQGSGRRSFVAPGVHIVMATTSQLVEDPVDAFRFLRKKYGMSLPSLITFVTGPSRTADIEKTLIHGMHGPRELYLFMLDTGSE